MERTGVVTFKGGPLTLVGAEGIKVGAPAPDLLLSKSLLEDVKLSSYQGKTVILNIVPSIDTGVCSIQTARFNQEAGKLGDAAVVLTLSLDLPVAQARWCQANSASNIVMVSDYKHRDAATRTGLLIKELGLLARAVYVIAPDGKVKYGQVVPEMTTEPNYEAALAAV